MKNFTLQTILILAAATTVASAGVPEPDAVLYGTITLGEGIDQRIVSADGSVQVIARVNGVPLPVGTYTMGDDPSAGNLYILRIRVESLADGSAQSDNKALIGQTARIFVKTGGREEQLAFSFPISERGIALETNLFGVSENVGAPIPGGGFCGFGLLPLLPVMGLGLFFAKYARRRRMNASG